jgi:hypothetical protein
MEAQKKQSVEGPVFNGLLPAQIDALRKPIFIGDVATHPHHKWPYIKGTTVITKLNRIFGFDGWSTRNMQVTLVDKSVVKDGDKTQYRSTVLVVLELVIRTPGGREFVRAGVGADEKASKNFIDTVDNSAASAVTYAIRNAAITLGHQFGLAVQRMKLKDQDGRDVDWRRLCSDERLAMPDLVLLSQILEGKTLLPDGRTFDPTTGVVDEPDPHAALGEDDERSGHSEDVGQPDTGHREPAPEPRREPTEDEKIQARWLALRDECANVPLNMEDIDGVSEQVMEQRTRVKMRMAQILERPASAKGVEHLQAVRDALVALHERLKAERRDEKKPEPEQRKVDDEPRGNGTDAQERSSGASNEREGRPAEGSAPATREEKRKKCIGDVRSLWQRIGKEPGKEIWVRVCADHNRGDLQPMMIAKPESEKGPNDELLVALRHAFAAAAKEGT